MKKLTSIIAALALFFSASAFTPTPKEEALLTSHFKVSNLKINKTENVTSLVSKAFKQKFTTAENVDWKQNENIYFAEFLLDKKTFKAAYSEDGELLAISRNLMTDQLPIAVITSLNEHYRDYKIPTNVTEIAMQGSTNYYLTVEGKSQFLQIRCSPDGNIFINKKIKRNF